MRRIGYLLLDTGVTAGMSSAMILKFLNLGVVRELHLPAIASFTAAFAVIAFVTIAFVKEETL